MKKSAWYVVLLLIVLVVSVAVSIYAVTNDDRGSKNPDTEISENLPPETGTPDTPNVNINVVTSPDPSASPSPTPTPTPTPTLRPAPTPTPTPTPPPTPTPTPSPTPIQNVSATGSFVSNSGTGLNIRVDWAAYTSGGNVMLNVDVDASHYSFYTSALWNAVELRVNGVTYTANSKEVAYDGDALTYTPMATFDVPAQSGNNSIEVIWHYRGTYSGVELDTIEASGTAYIG